MLELKDGMRVIIKSTQEEWDKYGHGICPYYAEKNPVVSNDVTDAYRNHTICIVTNAHNEKEGWVCDLRTPNGNLLSGFYAWELKKAHIVTISIEE